MCHSDLFKSLVLVIFSYSVSLVSDTSCNTRVWFLGDHLGGPDQQPPSAPESTIRGRLSAGEVS